MFRRLKRLVGGQTPVEKVAMFSTSIEASEKLFASLEAVHLADAVNEVPIAMKVLARYLSPEVTNARGSDLTVAVQLGLRKAKYELLEGIGKNAGDLSRTHQESGRVGAALVWNIIFIMLAAQATEMDCEGTEKIKTKSIVQRAIDLLVNSQKNS